MSKGFRHEVEHTGFGQDSYARCWFAAYRMMLKYLKRNPDEVQSILTSKINFDDAYDKGLLVSDYKVCADALGFDILDTAPFRKEQGFFDIGLSDGAEAFIEQLNKKPLWVSRYVEKGVYHITIAVGFDGDTDEIIFNNPFPGPKDARDGQRLKANFYVKHITRQIGSVQVAK